jgi:hypothetical protein
MRAAAAALDDAGPSLRKRIRRRFDGASVTLRGSVQSDSSGSTDDVRPAPDEASLHQRLEALRAENQRLRDENARLQAELAIGLRPKRHARGA